MVTIKTIAKIAGVSHTTVSRALNDNPAVKEKTRKKIKKIALDLGYVPNLSARGLVNNRTYTIGLFFSNINEGTSSSFLTEVIKRFHDALDKEYMLSVNSIDDLDDFNIAMQSRLDGIIVVSQSQRDDAFIDYVHQTKIPLVVLNRSLIVEDICNIGFDDYLGAYQAAEYGIRMGHQTFGMIQGIASFHSTTERTKGFLDAVHKQNLTVIEPAIVAGNYSSESGYRAMKQILLLPEPPSFVFCANDDMAIGALKACSELNVRVPQDISIVGFDDSLFSAYTIPALTTIKKPIDQLAQLGMQALSQLMSATEPTTDKELIKPDLIIRDSVRNLSF
ncbi:LacI family DNA-binding transcriptional regulator [Loigolactobacillus coryniformis]|uniref:LacI family DNA-binding transcriptional regulator n=1 Tax=Loigolactobacillus coryniformis TaxID=1610 RepID=UPI001C5D6EAD|nr:LacI family DNA-binding transcriptional regulator [Loigolactobacillus coryniformis]MBW4803719.1 LacI family DNA-binding transcriptional regulator [Loigolactobacillus coryniformis subsp. torquens]MBW4806421.1 LacI family DNA-binding transcriptional regulator [Loigolactobacillus coryniformis subsp. torquens]